MITIAVLVLSLLGDTGFAKSIAKMPIPASVQKDLDEMYSSYSIVSSAIGDLNNDGIADYAAVIRKEDKNMCAEVVVFWGRRDGSFEFYAKSKELKSSQRLPELDIDKKSLILATHHNSLSMASGEAYQFKFEGTDLYLIGVETNARAPVWEDEA